MKRLQMVFGTGPLVGLLSYGRLLRIGVLLPIIFGLSFAGTPLSSDNGMDFKGGKNFSINQEDYLPFLKQQTQKVVEFRSILEIANSLGVRVWLFGGTAAAFAHYAKLDLQRIKGDSRLQPHRFDYSYSNIFRSTQDLDLVVDGSEIQAEELQKRLSEQYPYMEGGKSAWEVRLLKGEMLGKTPLLNNFDFLNQHSDSHSTGMIEITESADPQLKDLRAWTSQKPPFLSDVLNGVITYHFSSTHFKTEMAKNGDNPEIFSVIRLLTKAFQYDLEISGSSDQEIHRIIKDFVPKTDIATAYSVRRLQKLATNMVRHAVDVEKAISRVKELGLREKLLSQSDTSSVESMAWWLNKQPLQSFPLGSGTGRTAEAMGIDIVAHETLNFVAFESITRSHLGDPNAFISREETPGENANFGEGFYTQVGTKGARNTGFHIRFQVDPSAKEGKDFFVAGSYIIFLNKRALKVIPESINVGLLEYFLMLDNGMVDSDERGQIEMFRRKISVLSELAPEDEKELVALVENNHIAKESEFNSLVLEEWFRSAISVKYPNLAFKAIGEISSNRILNSPWEDLVLKLRTVMTAIFRNPAWKPYWPEIRSLVYGSEDQLRSRDLIIIETILPSPIGPQSLEIIDDYLGRDNAEIDLHLATYGFVGDQWLEFPEIVERLIDKPGFEFSDIVVSHILSRPGWEKHPHLIRKILAQKNPSAIGNVVRYIILNRTWSALPDMSEFIDTVLAFEESDIINLIFINLRLAKANSGNPKAIESFLSHLMPRIVDHRDASQLLLLYVREMVDLGQDRTSEYFWNVVNHAKVEYQVLLVRYLKPSGPNSLDEEILDHLILTQPHPEIDREVIRNILTQEEWFYRKDWREAVLSRVGNGTVGDYSGLVASHPKFLKYEDLDTILEVIPESPAIQNLMKAVSARPEYWKKHPDALGRIVKKGYVFTVGDWIIDMMKNETVQSLVLPPVVEYLVTKAMPGIRVNQDRDLDEILAKSWGQNPEFLKATGGQTVNTENLKRAFENGFSFEDSGDGEVPLCLLN